LFIKETDEFTAKWEGNLHTQEEAAQRSGIKQVFWLSELPRMLDRILAKYSTIYLNAEESLESNMPSPAKRRAATLRETFPLHTLRSAIPHLTRQRMIKAPEEVAQIRRAVDITRAGLLAAWAATRPGLAEYAVEAELTAAYLRHGATGQGFMPIIASGRGTTVIHYMHNDATIGDHDLVLFDTGAEAGYYAADISRTIPASGRFTPRQRALYEAVLRVQQAVIPLHKPGATIWGIDEFMRERLLEELVVLKILTATQAKSKAKFKLLHEYYGHISHHLGLDCHDSDDFRTPLKPGAVVTCEPGLYLREEGIGVRIEDDILITDIGCEVLSKAIPSAPDELEALMGSPQR
jgi:Xaa-Pro aminopeptidase